MPILLHGDTQGAEMQTCLNETVCQTEGQKNIFYLFLMPLSTVKSAMC